MYMYVHVCGQWVAMNPVDIGSYLATITFYWELLPTLIVHVAVATHVEVVLDVESCI